MLITAHARIRRAAAQVFVGKVLNDMLVNVLGEIQNIVRNIEDLRRALGVLNAVHATARRLLAVGVIDAKAHRDPDDIMPGVLHHPGHDRRIHPARHSDEDFFLFVSLCDHKSNNLALPVIPPLLIFPTSFVR